MKLCEIFEPELDRSVKQDELRAKVNKLKKKSKANNPKHEWDKVEGRSQKPEYTALGGHVQKGLSGASMSDD